jgi:hypothetical protein
MASAHLSVAEHFIIKYKLTALLVISMLLPLTTVCFLLPFFPLFWHWPNKVRVWAKEVKPLLKGQVPI